MSKCLNVKNVTTRRIQHGNSEVALAGDQLHMYGKSAVGVQPRGIARNTKVHFSIVERYGDNTGDLYVDENRSFVIDTVPQQTVLMDTFSSAYLHLSGSAEILKGAITYNNDIVFSGVNLLVSEFGTYAKMLCLNMLTCFALNSAKNVQNHDRLMQKHKF